jgi:hypothetical protein
MGYRVAALAGAVVYYRDTAMAATLALLRPVPDSNHMM